jgi:hypothetical protein
MDQVNKITNQVQSFVMANPIPVAGVLFLIIFILVIVLLSKMEGFEGVTEGLRLFAEYPAAFAEAVVPEFIKETVYDNYFTKNTEEVKPNEVPMSQLELPTHSVTVPIDIGNGLSVNADIQVPSQTVTVPTQIPVTLPTASVSDVAVSAQSVQIPAQSGIIPGAIDGTGAVVSVPVDIPAQIVQIPAQNAVVPVMEPFRMM